MSLHELIKNYKSRDMYPFHMPGHKGNKAFIDEDLLSLDLTELPDTDNLLNPRGAIKETLCKLSEAYKSDESLLLVNGGSVGILAAVLGTALGKDILLSRNSHKSAYAALALADCRPCYVYPKKLFNGIYGGVSPYDVEEALTKNPEVKAVLIQSPTYEGFVSDLRAIASVTHAHNIPLIVDEAHGAHFPASKCFPQSAMECGADISVNSLHKTLPALTQTAAIHLSGSLINKALIKSYVNLLQTTSPSYIFMSLCDKCLSIMGDDSLFEGYISRLDKFRRSLDFTKHIRLLGKDVINTGGIFDMDLSRLTFLSDDAALVCKGLEKHKVAMEYSGLSHFIGISTVCDTDEGFRRLENGIKALDLPMEKPPYPDFKLLSPRQAKSPKEAFNAPFAYCPLNQSAGHISADFVIPYPPGIPLLAPGEEISAEAVALLKELPHNNLIGLNNDQIKIIKEVD